MECLFQDTRETSNGGLLLTASVFLSVKEKENMDHKEIRGILYGHVKLTKCTKQMNTEQYQQNPSSTPTKALFTPQRFRGKRFGCLSTERRVQRPKTELTQTPAVDGHLP